VLYGEVCAKVSEQMRKPAVHDYFTRLVQRTSPKSYAQAAAEVTVTRRFFENFSGDQVGLVGARGLGGVGFEGGGSSWRGGARAAFALGAE